MLSCYTSSTPLIKHGKMEFLIFQCGKIESHLVWSTLLGTCRNHYDDVIMVAMASQITSLTNVYSNVYSGRLKKTSKLRVTGLCAGNLPVTGGFPAQMASNAKNVHLMTLSCKPHLMMTTWHADVFSTTGSLWGGIPVNSNAGFGCFLYSYLEKAAD